MKNFPLLFALTVLFVICLFSCKSSKKETMQADTEEVLPEDIVEMRYDQQKLAGIDTGRIIWQTIGGTVRANGIVTASPENIASVCLPMGGYVKNTTLMAGSSVKKGQVLAVIESNEVIDMQQHYLEAKNRMAYAEAEYNRHNQLYEEDIYSQKNLQQVNAEYRNLKAEVRALEQKLGLIGIDCRNLNEDVISSSVNVISPISGYIRTVNVNLGKYVAPSDVMFEIINTDDLLLELTLFEKDAGKILKDQRIRFLINNETEEHDAVIYQTSQSVDNEKTYKVYAGIKGTCKRVLPGMYVNAIIEISGNHVPVVPTDAVVSFDDNDYIFVFDKNKEEDGKPFTEYRMIKVTKGFTDKGFTEINLPEGFDMKHAIVVIKGAYNLLSAKKNAGEMAC